MDNNFFALTSELQKNIDWLNRILKGDTNDSVTIDGLVKPSITKSINDQYLALQTMVSGRLNFKTKSELDAAGAPPNNELAEVWKDVEKNNGLYGWTGSAWEKSQYDVKSAFESKISNNEASISVLDSLVTTSAYAGYEAKITSTAASPATRFNDTPFANHGLLKQIEIAVLNASEIKFKRARPVSASRYEISDLFSVFLSPGIHLISDEIPDNAEFLAGDYLAIYSPINAVCYDPGESWSVDGDVVGEFGVSQSGANISINAIVSCEGGALSDVIEGVRGKSLSFGNDLTGSSLATAGSTRILSSLSPGDELISSIEVDVHQPGSGEILFYVFDKYELKYTVAHVEQFTGLVAGKNTLSPVNPINLKSNQSVGVYSDSLSIKFLPNEGSDLYFVGKPTNENNAIRTSHQWSLLINYHDKSNLNGQVEYLRSIEPNISKNIQGTHSIFGNEFTGEDKIYPNNLRILSTGMPDERGLLSGIEVDVKEFGDGKLEVFLLERISYDEFKPKATIQFTGLVNGKNALALSENIPINKNDVIAIYTNSLAIKGDINKGSDLSYYGRPIGRFTATKTLHKWSIKAAYVPDNTLRGAVDYLVAKSKNIKSSLELNAVELNAKLKDPVLHFDNLNILPESWIENGGWIFDNGAHSPESGSYDTYFASPYIGSSDQGFISSFVDIKDSDSIFSLITHGIFASAIGEIDGAAQKLRLFGQWKGVGYTPSNPREVDIGFPLISGHRYSVVLKRDMESITEGKLQTYLELSIADLTTQQRSSIKRFYPEIDCMLWGAHGFLFKSGALKVESLSYTTLQPRNPKVAFFGDSITEGNSIHEYRQKRWVAMLKSHLGGDGFISGRGGATSSDLLVRFSGDFDPIYPSYVVIMIGTNDSNLDIWRTNINVIIDKILEKGATPILCTLPPRADRQAFINQVNAYVKSSGYRYINHAAALTDNNDELNWNPALVLPDMVHPNVDGHNAMYNQALCDAPDIFG